MGGELLKYEIDQKAYVKLVLHAIKHNTCAVNGILLGRLVNQQVVEISDIVPLSHSHIGLLPTLEIALIQVEEYFSSQGLSIVGYYHANERFHDSELGNVSKKIGDHINCYFPQVALILLDNKKLEALSKTQDQNPVVQLYTRDSTKNWKLAGTGGTNWFSIKQPSANIVLLDYISSKKWQEVVDFDDHLDNISQDWLNPNLFK